MAKVILNKLAPPDSPIYNQPLVIGGWFTRPSFSTRKRPSPVGNTLVDKKLGTKPIRGRKKNAN